MGKAVTAEAAGAKAPVVSKGPDTPDTIFAVLARGASDPNTDVAKLEKLMDMYERVQAREAKVAYAAALARLQPKLPLLPERGVNKGNQSRYSLWEDVVGIITPIIAEEGFAMSFRTSSDPTSVTVTGVLTHSAGHEERTSLTLPVDTSGSKNDVQGFGSSTSYGKRYTASALLNLRGGERDDDGQAAGGATTISESQVADLKAKLTETGANMAQFLKWAKVKELSEIRSSSYDAVCAMVSARARARG